MVHFPPSFAPARPPTRESEQQRGARELDGQVGHRSLSTLKAGESGGSPGRSHAAAGWGRFPTTVRGTRRIRRPGSPPPRPRRGCAPRVRTSFPSSGRRGVGAIAYGVLSEPMVFLLLASGGIYFLLGDRQEAIILLGFVADRRRHHALSGAQDGAGARGAARPVESARARRSATGSARGSPGARWCGATCWSCPRAIASRPTPSLLSVRAPQHRRIAADGRVGAGPQARPATARGARRWSGPAATICRSSTRARWSRRGRRRPRSLATGARDGDGPDRQGAARRRAREERAAARDAATGAPAGGGRGRAVCRRRGRIWPWPRRLAGRPARRAHAGDGDPPQRVPRRAHHLPGAGRLAPVSQARARAADARARDARLGDRAVRRQDRHADAEPDDGAPAVRRAARASTSRSTTGRRCPSSSTSWSSTRSWRASAIRSTRWRRRSRRSASAGSRAPSTCTPAGRWCGSIPCRIGCSRCRTSGVAGRRRARHRGEGRLRGDRRPVPPRPRERPRALDAEAEAMARRGAAGAGGRQGDVPPRRAARRSSTTSTSSSSGWWAWPIRFARPSRRRSRSATRPAFAS